MTVLGKYMRIVEIALYFENLLKKIDKYNGEGKEKFFFLLIYPIVCIVLFFQIYHNLQALLMLHEAVPFYTFSIFR